ncbi:hypothetical protein [Methanobrevibacter sp.]|uniref:hypothetical protein n=1 Tax=Methanobrevibacter sp. TaxID=66852 RepID=UPI00388D4A1F
MQLLSVYLTYIYGFIPIDINFGISLGMLVFVFVATWLLTELYVKIKGYIIH